MNRPAERALTFALRCQLARARASEAPSADTEASRAQRKAVRILSLLACITCACLVVVPAQAGGLASSTDVSAPTIQAVRTVAQGAEPSSAGVQTDASVTQLLVQFDEAMQPIMAKAFVLQHAGEDDAFGEASCTSPAGDDMALAPDDIEWAQDGTLAAVLVGGGAALPVGRWRLLACDSLVDLEGNPLADSPQVFVFETRTSNLLLDPNLDDADSGNLEAWTKISSDEASPSTSDEDAGDAPSSGSVWLGTTLGGNAGLSQCLPVPPMAGFVPGLRLRISGLAYANMLLYFYSGPDCTGAYRGHHWLDIADADTGGAWVRWDAAAPLESLAPASSMRMRFQGVMSMGSNVRFDDLTLAVESVRVFGHGFESP